MLVRPQNPDVQVPLRHKMESAPVPQPLQLKHAPFAHPVCSTGQWIAQYSVDRTADNNRFANLRDAWVLPKRNQLTRLFLGGVEARITSGGSLAVLVDNTVDRIEINEPDDPDLFHSLLHKRAEYSYPDIRHQLSSEASYQYSQPSDKGRYLQGVLGMFGSLDRAYEVLTHGFWRRKFIELGSPSENQYPQIIRTLKNRFPPQGGNFTFEREEQWEKLARLVVRQAVNVRQPKYTVKLQTLINEWLIDLGRAIESDANLQKRKDRILAEGPRELTRSLDGLCREGVFHQGYSWNCRHCAYRNWTALDALRMTLECQVCHQEHNTPIDLKFAFRLNEFLATCIREHDTLSVIWALGELQRQEMNSSFIFTPQMELFRKWPDNQTMKADREIDILCVINGKVVVGEVKASLSEIDRIELDNLIAVASDIRPDIVVIGAIEGEKQNLDSKLEEVRKKVGPGIEVKGLLGGKDWNDVEPYLP